MCAVNNSFKFVISYEEKIEIIGLTILILIATTGVPLSYHLWNMMQEKSFNECEIFSSTLSKEFTSCCAPDDNQNLISISSDKSAKDFTSEQLLKLNLDWANHMWMISGMLKNLMR